MTIKEAGKVEYLRAHDNSKLMGIGFLGLILVWFVPESFSYFSAFLPSFWIGKLLMDGTSLFLLTIGFIVCLLWIAFFTKKFLNRIG